MEFQAGSEINDILEGAAIWFFTFFRKKPALAIANTTLQRTCLKQKYNPLERRPTTLTSYPKDVDYLLRTYVTDKNITDTEYEISMFTQPLIRNLLQYAERLLGKGVRFENVYEKLDLNQTFIIGLDKSIPQSMGGHWVSRQSASTYGLAFHET